MKPTYNMPDEHEPNGNIFSIISQVVRILKLNDMTDKADELKTRILVNNEAKSYEQAKQIIGEYVDVE